MECNTILSSIDDDDFVLIDGDSIAYVKCECTNSGNAEKEKWKEQSLLLRQL